MHTIHIGIGGNNYVVVAQVFDIILNI